MIGACVSANFSLKRDSDAWNANGGIDHFYKVDGTTKGFLKVAVDAIECLSISEKTCYFGLASGSSVTLEFNGKNEMKSWIDKEKANLAKFKKSINFWNN